MDIVTYKLSQKYADKVAAGFSSVRVDGLDIIFTLNDGKTATVTVPAPKDGQDGVSIINVSLNQQSHLICTLSDGTAIDAGLVHQGVDGKDGKDGVDGAPGQDGKDGKDGVDGQDGNGIISIEKTGTEGLVDTYTIYFTNGTTTTFTVTNGSGGSGTGNYTDLTNKPTINNVELNGNKTSSDLGLQPAGNYITNTDYATSSVGGVLKVSNGDYGMVVDEGVLKGAVRTITQYENMSSKGMICKGTLENVLTDKDYQEELVSGTNIKTINNVSILGSGNIDIEGGGISPLADKNIVVFGDSLTDPQSGGTSWTESFINIAEYNSFRGYGRGYCTWTFKNNTEYNITDNTDANVGSNVIWNQFNKLKHDVDNNNTPIPDIIMIFCADNDIMQSKTIGSESATFKAAAQSSDVKTLTNMMDSIRYNIDTINAEYPNCIIVPIIPLLPSQYDKSKTYRDALITCYNNLGLSYIDVMYGSGIAWYREMMKRTYFASDGVHLSEAGSMKIAKFIYQSLITMPRIQKLPGTVTNKGLYNIYYNLTNASSTNSFVSVMQGEAYRTTIVPTTGYVLNSVTCTMGGVTQPVQGGVINIANVTGNITITATAGAPAPTPTTYTVTNNLTNATNSNSATTITEGESYTAYISPIENYKIDSLTCTMGGVQQTVTDNTINIASVSGNIVVTAVASEDTPPAVSYTITNNLTHATNSNGATTVEEGSAYSATISAEQGYHITSVTCTMGGAQQTVTNNYINIVSVSGDIVITAVAEEDQPAVTYTITNNLTNVTNSNPATTIEEGSSYTATITASQGYNISSIVCTMGGVEQVVANNTIYIASVNGNIVITATATQFTPVEGAYIHNDGDCWVGSSYYTSKNTTKVEVVAEIHSFSGNYGYLVGASDTKLCQWGDKVVLACVAGTATQQNPANQVAVSYDKKFTVVGDIANKVITITDEDGTRTGTIIVGATYKPESMWYFAGYWKDNFEHKSGDMKVYSMRIWEGDTLVYEGYPVYDETNGAGMYDIISGDTHYNEGTGTLTYGVDSAS